MFLPSAQLQDWAHETFIEDGAELLNEDHRHLRMARVGFLWTNVANARNGRRVVGNCQLGRPSAIGKWARAREEMQLRAWFAQELDFLITLDAVYAAQAGDAEFCSLVEHELYHAGQERDEFGAPKFRKSGMPAFGMRGHDVEEFVGIVRRYGVGAAAGDTLALVQAAQSNPEVAATRISQACGTCLTLRHA